MPAHPTQGPDARAGLGGHEPLGSGMLPYDENPRFVNPTSGILGNTNNKTVDRPFPRPCQL